MEPLATSPALRVKDFGIPSEAKARRYPLRLARYWFGYHLLREEAANRGRALDVAEIGVHSGQMLQFYRAMPDAPPIRRWTAYDAVLLERKLQKVGYCEMVQADVEAPEFRLQGHYDAAIALHILEHLRDPEAALARIAVGLREGGVVIGGFPVLPGPMRAPRQWWLRHTAASMGHVSAFSTGRVTRMAKSCGLQVEFLSGAFFLRSKGAWWEDSSQWYRFNVLWGALFPWWPGEIYWRLRKP